MAIQFDGIVLADLSAIGLPASPSTGELAFDGSLQVWNGSAWETFNPVAADGSTSTITMGASQQILGEGGSTNPADSAPSYAFTGDLNTGLWNPSDGVIRLASDSIGVAEFDHDNGLTMLTGQILAPSGGGTVGAPSYSVDGDTQTGMWFPADDTIAWSVGGSQAFTITPSGLLQVNTVGYTSLLTSDNDIPNKAYVDNLSAGLDPKQSVRAATTTDLDTETTGSWGAAGSGQGKTLTNATTGSTTLDSILLVLGDRVLVKDEAGGLGATHNGIYEVTTDGNALPEITDVDFTSHTISDGDYWLLKSANDATSYYVWYGTTDPTPGGTGINVALQGSPGAYATATASAIDALGDFSAPAPSGNVVTITNAATGTATDAADVSASVVITIVQDGKIASGTVLTRSDDQDGTPSNEVSGGNFTTVEAGSTWAGSMWAVVWDGDVVVDTDPMNWTQIGGSIPASGFPLLAPVNATPQYSFTGDTNTGIASPSGDRIDLIAGGGVEFSILAAGPQLGADLDVNGNIITTSVTNGPVIVASDGTGVVRLRQGATTRLLVDSAGTITVGDTANYEDLVTGAGDIPNRQWVVDQNYTPAVTLIGQTTTDTPFELSENGSGTGHFDLTDNTTYAVEILLVARKSDGSENAMWKILVGVERTSGTTALVGSDTTTTISNTPGWSVAVTADDTNDRLAVTVTGAAATTIDWKAEMTWAEV